MNAVSFACLPGAGGFFCRVQVAVLGAVLTLLPSAACQGADTAQAAAPVERQGMSAPFTEPYIDIDEWRGTPVRHRYVHGGFKGTDTRFSFYFPDKAHYQGRFFQHITPVPDDENLAQKVPPGEDNKIGFAIASGAYFVETNGGGKFDLGKIATTQMDPTISAYRANAAAAEYSRVVAMQMYGGARPFGYAYGGSGGGYRTIVSCDGHRCWGTIDPKAHGATAAFGDS